MRRIVVGETDLAVYLCPGVWDESLVRKLKDELISRRSILLNYIRDNPDFAAAHQPWPVDAHAPLLVRRMITAGIAARVGPMAAVAGALAEIAGRSLKPYSPEVIVENGGDIYLCGERERIVAVYAGEGNPFTHKLAIRLRPDQLPCGVCTSSATVGRSFSYGKADAALIVAPDAALADAVATAAANMVKGPEDVESACNAALAIPGVAAALIICKDQLAAAGDIELCEL